jgi:hypothetical protein
MAIIVAAAASVCVAALLSWLCLNGLVKAIGGLDG